MIALERHPEGTIMPVRAQPGGRHNRIRGRYHDMLKVCVTQVAEKGKANKVLLEVLSKGLSLRKSQLELIAGQTSAQKKFLVRGITPEELAERIERALKGDD